MEKRSGAFSLPVPQGVTGPSREPFAADISDTARWVAMYRAMETDRPDAHFRDPYARDLAGARGEVLAAAMPHSRVTSWALIVRTCLMDDVIQQCVDQRGADAIVNLGAGLDTRPYRLELPAQLRWYEVDLPGILAYKEQKLADEAPRCRLERVSLDLTDLPARKELFSRIGRETARVLVVAEGLLVYFRSEEVASLATDLAAPPSFRWWLVEVLSSRIHQWLRRLHRGAFVNRDAVMRFFPEEGTAFYEPYGWKLDEFRSTWEESRRLNRSMPFSGALAFLQRFASEDRREAWRTMAGCALLERA